MWQKDSGIKIDKSSFDSLFPKNHFLSHLTVFCDVRFIYDKLEKNDCFDLAHTAYMLNMVFKYLLFIESTLEDGVKILFYTA